MIDDGYRDLRHGLRASLHEDEIRARRTALTARARNLAQATAQSAVGAALENVRRSVSDFMEAALTFAETSVERSVLIEKQIDGRDFTGQLHDEYHAIWSRFESHYHSAITHGKRLANSIASLVYELLPHDQRRGIASGSFGSMYNRLIDIDDDQPEPLKSARSILTDHGEFLETVVHEYRDDEIEHFRPHPSVDRGVALTSDDRIDIVRSEDRARAEPDPDYTRDPDWPGWMYRDFWRHTGPHEPGADPAQEGAQPLGYEYHVHVHANLDLEEGQSVNAEVPIAFVTDGGSGHFDAYGGHSHVFSSRDIPSELTGEPDVVYGMPGIVELVQRYATLTSDTLDLAERLSAAHE